ncbi:WD40 domain containing protein [Pyrrhoderma noxium]|uniref:WD40 domain containing protein n=1 Tax=Pyrrhoderma noxium TaxID=2282107 RepID=A0A286UCU1_9AGAM|nr:WD40 domain containing protein [Pyrrhoderma noxium]
MATSLKHDICNLQSSPSFGKNVKDLGEPIRGDIPFYLQYLRSFVYNQLLFWFEVISLMGIFSDHVGAGVTCAILWIEDRDVELTTFLRDAYRQATTFSDPISQCAIHIYTSLLPIAKEDLIVAKHYSQYADVTLGIEYIGEKIRSRRMKVIKTNNDFVLSISFSPDGTRIVTASSNNRIANSFHIEPKVESRASSRVLQIWNAWDAFTGELIWEPLVESKSPVNSVEFSPDGKLIASGSGSRSVLSVSFSPDGQYLVSGSDDNSIIVWCLHSRTKKINPLIWHIEAVQSVRFSPCGKNIVSGSYDKGICIWSLPKGEVVDEIDSDTPVHSVAYSPDGSHILACQWLSVIIWNVADPAALHWEIPLHYFSLSASFAPDGTRFVAGLLGTADVFDATEELEAEHPFQPDSTSPITVSPSGKFIASGPTGRMLLWSVDGGQLVPGSWTGEIHLTRSVAWSPDDGKSVKLGNGVINPVVFSPNGKYIASCSLDSTVYGKRVVSGSPDKCIRIWSTTTCRLISTSSKGHVQYFRLISILKGHSASVTAVTYSPDGSRIVSGSEDNTIRVWDAKNSRHRLVCRPITGHTDRVSSVSFSPDGKQILSGSYDKTIRIWDASTGNLLFGPFWGHTGIVNSLYFFPDGRRFVSGSHDGAIRIWSLDDNSNEANSVSNWHLRTEDGWVIKDNVIL